VPKLPRISGHDAVRAPERLGFVAVRQRGSHVVLKRVVDQSTQGCVVPMHKELAIGTLHSLLRQAQVSVEEFIAHL